MSSSQKQINRQKLMQINTWNEKSNTEILFETFLKIKKLISINTKKISSKTNILLMMTFTGLINIYSVRVKLFEEYVNNWTTFPNKKKVNVRKLMEKCTLSSWPALITLENNSKNQIYGANYSWFSFGYLVMTDQFLVWGLNFLLLSTSKFEIRCTIKVIGYYINRSNAKYF